MTKTLEQLLREMERYRDEQRTIANEHRKIADEAAAEADRVDRVVQAARSAQSPTRRRKT